MRLKLKNRDIIFFSLGLMIIGSAFYFKGLHPAEDILLRYMVLTSVGMLLFLQIRFGLDYLFPLKFEDKNDMYVIHRFFKKYEVLKSELAIEKIDRPMPAILIKGSNYKQVLYKSLYDDDEMLGLVSYLAVTRI